MLCDDLLHWCQKGEAGGVVTSGASRLNSVIIDRLKRAQRFALSPLFVETAFHMAAPVTIERSREHLFTPAFTTWMECAGKIPGVATPSSRHGMLLDGESDGENQSIRAGICVYVSDATIGGKRIVVPWLYHYDLAGTGPILKPVTTNAPPGIDPPRIDVRRFGAWIGATLALISTPRLTIRQPVDVSKINRGRRLRLPALEYTKITIDIDRADATPPGSPSTEGRPLHHVRTHFRIRRGRVEVVKPHWRGNPDIGVRISRYVVRRAEDEGGRWDGGPLPAPQILGRDEPCGTDR